MKKELQRTDNISKKEMNKKEMEEIFSLKKEAVYYLIKAEKAETEEEYTYFIKLFLRKDRKAEEKYRRLVKNIAKATKKHKDNVLYVNFNYLSTI
ncbi:MAG: hypothetical protein ACPLVF_02065 [Thermovenabulum sp.]|uniref:hypothetical protein n=1 Tax=Thermovenabulum sp. TaxID=3100335 RepID=UPI003C7C96DB